MAEIGGGFMRGFAARGREDRAKRALSIQEAQLGLAVNQQRRAVQGEQIKAINENMAKLFEQAQKTLEALDQSGVPRNDPRVKQALAPIVSASVRLATTAEGFNVPGTSGLVDITKGRFKNLMLSPTPEQAATTEGRAAGVQEVATAEVLTGAAERDENLARALGLEEKPPDSKAVFNLETRLPQFATEEEIQANPNLVPMETMEALGVGGEGEKITASQRLAAGFAARTEQAHQVINEIGEQFTGLGSRFSGITPQGLKSEDRQRFDQAQRNFINAILRRESGAAIAPTEFESAAQQYFPQPGDSPEVLEQKRINRQTVVEALKLEAGPAFTQLKTRIPNTVTINGKSVQVGTIVTNQRGQKGRVEQDGSITILE